eukprot:SAG11_NODE_34551_length_271_cov_0.877907_1_plen_28_part_01
MCARAAEMLLGAISNAWTEQLLANDGDL